MTKVISNLLYTPLAERTRTATGRTAAGDRRKARSLGFQSIKALQEHHEALMDLNPWAAANLFAEFVTVGTPDENWARRLARGLRGDFSHRQFKRYFQRGYALKMYGHAYGS